MNIIIDNYNPAQTVPRYTHVYASTRACKQVRVRKYMIITYNNLVLSLLKRIQQFIALNS